MIRGRQGEEGWRKDGGKGWWWWGGGWHDTRKGERMVRGGGDGDAGDGGRVSELWWVMKYSVRVCLWLLPSFFLSTSLADSFIYWGPCGSRNSFAVVLPFAHQANEGREIRSEGGRERLRG